jgi:CBS domain containing-hemolysin-like protein
MITDLITVAAALLVLVFLSTVESAYESLSEVSLRLMETENLATSRGRFFHDLMEQRLRLELALIFGTQLSIVVIAIFLLDLSVRLQFAYPLFSSLAVTLVFVVLFRQLVPRLLAQNRPERVLWTLLPLFRLFYRPFNLLVSPVSFFLSRSRNPEPEPVSEEEQAEDAREEIQAFIDVGEEQGIIEESEGEMIQSIVEFSDTRVGEVMRPRPQIVAIESTATVAEARRLIIESKYSRIPVYNQELDNIEGILYVRDLLAFCEPDKLSEPVKSCMRPAYFVPETKSVADLLEEMQKAKVQIAIVIDEYGTVAGLVTVEDIVEEIVGEIEDEDRVPAQDEIVKAEDGSYLVDGAAEIRKVELLFDREIEADDFTTVAGLVINELGHVPEVGEKLQYKGLEFEVAEADSRRINRVRLRAVRNADQDSIEAGQSHNG